MVKLVLIAIIPIVPQDLELYIAPPSIAWLFVKLEEVIFILSMLKQYIAPPFSDAELLMK